MEYSATVKNEIDLYVLLQEEFQDILLHTKCRVYHSIYSIFPIYFSL